MSSQQCGASVHVVLRLKHVHHLVGVELEHALHLHVLRVLLLSAIFCVLLLLLTSPLTLPDSTQISVAKVGGRRRGGKKKKINVHYMLDRGRADDQLHFEKGVNYVFGYRLLPKQSEKCIRQLIGTKWTCLELKSLLKKK